ncbi:Hsp20/alpha crystallin family protein [Desulfocurvus sp. DL9XJH121]
MAKYDWNPWKLTDEWDEELERMPDQGSPREAARAHRPRANVLETPAGLVIEVELPGVGREHVSLACDRGELVVSGHCRQEKDVEGGVYHILERSYGPFLRRFSLPRGVDPELASAVFRDGLLVVTVPRRGSGPSRRISVEAPD